MIQIGHHDNRSSWRSDLAGIEQPVGDDSADRRNHRGVLFGLLQRRDLRVHRGHPRTRGVDFFGTRSRSKARDPFTRRSRASPARRHPVSCHGPARRRIIALFLRSGVHLEKPLEPLQIHLGGGELGLGSGDVGGGSGGLSFGLANILAARAGLEQPKLRIGLRSVRLCPPQCQIDVGRIEACHDVALLHAIAFRDRHVDDAPADFRRDLHLGGIDLPRHASRGGGRFFLAGAEHDCRDKTETHASSLSYVSLHFRRLSTVDAGLLRLPDSWTVELLDSGLWTLDLP